MVDSRFMLDLHAAVAGDPDQGFAWSPYSVASALGLAAEGAAGATRAEIVTALGGDLPALAKALSAAAALDHLGDGGIAVANTLWADRTLPVAAEYAAAVRGWPGGVARTADFRHQHEQARQEVNADVERTTKGLIRDLVPPAAVDARTRAILVNALWLKVSWRTEFPKHATSPAAFAAPGGEIRVPTMRRTGRMRYAHGGGWTLVGLAAAGGVVADVLLPDGDLTALTPDGLAGLTAAAAPTEVELHLPKFTVDGQAELTRPLAELGIRALFTPAADLSPVTGGAEELMVSAVVHKAVLAVDEAGLEGAAATAMAIRATAAFIDPPRPVQVRVDRPFLMLVRHAETGAVYFLARVTRP